jgi:undecaprenyl-diphosphatase
MVFLTKKYHLLMIPLWAFILVRERYDRRVLMATAAAMASFGLSDWMGHMLKDAVGRIRPCEALDGVRLLVGCGGSPSMPSNHAANSFALAVPLFMSARSRLKYLFVLIAALVAYSRVYVGVHYPSDVLAGALLGAFIGSAVTMFMAWSFGKGAKKGFLFVFLAAITLFRFYYIRQGVLELSFDEAHYWEWARRPDIGYYSKGPLIAYLIRAGTFLFGNTEFGVRFFAPVLSLLGSLLLYRLGSLLHDEDTGVWSAFLFQAIPLFAAYGVIMTIDAPFVFFWILGLLLFYRACAINTLPEWLLLGLAAGLGLLAKFTMAFFPVSALLYLVFSRADRRKLLSPGPYAGLALGLLLLVPLVLWNMDHGWVTFRHNIGHAQLQKGLTFSPASFAEFLGSQLGVVTPLVFLMMLYAALRQRKEGPFSFWFFIPTLIFFVLKSLQGKVQANWAMAGYLTGIIAFSSVFLKDFGRSGRAKRALVATAIGLAVIVTAVSFYPGALGIPPQLDPSARLRGWKALAIHLDGGAIPELGKKGKPFFIFSDRYQVSSELAFYLKGQPASYCVNLGRRMNQYDLWPGFHGLVNHNALFVTIGDSELPEKLRAVFKGHEKRSFEVLEKGRLLRRYSIFLCYGFKGMKKEESGKY